MSVKMQQQPPVERKSRPRQEPVSCQSCRAKKLRCNRQQPCSNCLARGITCHHQSRPPPLKESSEREPTTSAGGDNDGAAILARLKRLEDVILGLNAGQIPSPQSDVLRSHSVTPSVRSRGDETGKTDSEFLEDVGIRTASLVSGLSDRILWNIASIQKVLNITPSLKEERTRSLPGLTNSVWLPTQEEAVLLFENYAKNIDYLQHVISAPSVRLILDDVYTHIVERQPVESSHVALLLSIFASTAYYWTSGGDCDRLFLASEDANQASLLWSKATLDVLEHSRRTTSGSIEDIQATIILSFLVFNLEGFSARAQSLMTIALVTARNLSLHKLDAQRCQKQGNARNSCIDIEVKRRIWWHIVATDWILAFTGGPQEGTYYIQPSHMNVRHPRNINDDDLTSADHKFERPLSEPTSMSYFLQRIRLAELCRSVVDSMPAVRSCLDQVEYQDVISLDSKFESFLMEVPIFLRLDEDSRRQSQTIDHEFPQIEIQRYLLNLGVHNRRCKLHRPFLVQCSQEPRYLYSREVCLRSARTVFQVIRLLESGKSSFASAHLRLCAVVHYVFMATVVLVMDLCFNKTVRPEEEQQRKEEVRDACRMLQDARGQSATAGKLLESLTDVLHKHKIWLLNLDADRAFQGSDYTTTGPSGVGTTKLDRTSPCSGGTTRHEPADSGNSIWVNNSKKQPFGHDFNSGDMWQDYVQFGVNSDEVDWDHLLADLDSHIA